MAYRSPKKKTWRTGAWRKKMKELVDWMWRTRWDRTGDDDKKWAPAAEIPRQLRPKLNQLLQYDWPNMNPYPGWVLAVEQGCSGWKCKLMNEKELRDYENDEEKNKKQVSKKGKWNNTGSKKNGLKKLPTRHQTAENQKVRQKTPREQKMSLRLNKGRLLQPLTQKVQLKVSSMERIYARNVSMNSAYQWAK